MYFTNAYIPGSKADAEASLHKDFAVVKLSEYPVFASFHVQPDNVRVFRRLIAKLSEAVAHMDAIAEARAAQEDA